LGDGLCYEACDNEACQKDGGDCCYASSLEQNFGLFVNGDEPASVLPDMSIPLERWVGRRNRLVAGVLLTQTRMETGECKKDMNTMMPDKWNLKKNFGGGLARKWLGGGEGKEGGERYRSLYEQCLTETISTDPFGVDAVFLPAAGLYNDKLWMDQFYDLEDVGAFNSGGMPYAFKYEAPSLPLLFLALLTLIFFACAGTSGPAPTSTASIPSSTSTSITSA
jgi:hypothetical protein